MSNDDDIRSAILNKLSQTLESQLRKANRQFEEYRHRNPRKNSPEG
jgi:ribosome-associated translation inhibitor RaiA